MYRCSEIVRLISSDEYLTAGSLKRLGIRLHLEMCRNCTRYVHQIRALAAAVREAGSVASPSEVEYAKAQILQRFSQKS